MSHTSLVVETMYCKCMLDVLKKLSSQQKASSKERKFATRTGLLMYDFGYTFDIYLYSIFPLLLSSFCTVDVTCLVQCCPDFVLLFCFVFFVVSIPVCLFGFHQRS